MPESALESVLEALPLYGAVALAGLAAGFINTMAGGGSLITLPALMLLGLPANVANGTNRLATVTQSVSGVLGFHRKGKLPTEAIAPIVLPTVAGAGIGAAVAAYTPLPVLEPLILGVLVTMALVLLLRPALLLPEEGEEPRALKSHVPSLLGLFVAGLYGGFIQGGVGFVLLAVLGGLLRYDIARANALKLVCTTLFGLVALPIFVYADQVRWVPAVVLALATTAGSQLGVRFAIQAPPKLVRGLLFCTVVVMCVAVALRS